MSVDRHPYPDDPRHAPLLRVLLALDGSTTRVCEAVARAPMSVLMLHQQQTADVPQAVREQRGGERWLHRVTSLHAHGHVLMDNLTYTRLDAVPDWFLAGLDAGNAPVGHLLAQLHVRRVAATHTPEVQQALWQHVGRPDLRASRSYNVVTAEGPLMYIFETFRGGMVAAA